ncbi:zinc ABC transporter substrate-binding protein [Halomonas aquamarina]|uniref:Zinc ABC transporter substrate-binding protein n=1 Tax=Vreelandella aquamarina TaxID=77097 RepID=A0ACC5W000_9GAMM|nr:zinc ABC transporter substrate-binding protein [Halomonas aquamarina]MBZ5489084.1 zinc ABC transporter substrate-binding protein [Halomonas aquamarina]
MHQQVKWVSTLLLAILSSVSPLAGASTFRVVASFPVLEDLVKRVAGDDISVSTVVPPGADVHNWELTPPNVLAIEEADILFYNGFGLEPWLRHVKAMSDDSLLLKSVAENADFTPQPILTGRYKGTPDPHMWLDPEGAAAYVEVIADTLAEHYPDQAEGFHARAQQTYQALQLLDQAIKERLDGVPNINRTLVTSEAGLGYFARAYDLEYAAIWGVNHETQGSAQAMAQMSTRLANERPPALFYESTVACIHMDAQAREHGIKLAGPLYVDTLSPADGPAYNYPAMLRHNAELIHEALGGARPD